MVRRGLLVALALLLAPLAAGSPVHLPPLVLEDQEGRTLAFHALRGAIVVVVYGTRAGLEHHLAWGQRLDAALRARGVYRHDDGPMTRPVRILAVAQMGGVPAVVRPIVRAALRPHVEAPYSLWLDWEDRMSGLFGASNGVSRVVVADRDGVVRLVVTGRPEGAPYRAVTDLLASLL